jgi:hypothetical protein
MTHDTQHTPGPWAIYEWDNKVHIEATGRNLIATIARKEQDANAHLIAAAPDMLDALDDVLAIGPGKIMPDAETYAKCQAAIAKARGQ